MPSTIERAFELARAGHYNNVTDLKRKLVAEGHESVDAHISGAAIKGQLIALFRANKTPAKP
jgi:hypothetical protein